MTKKNNLQKRAALIFVIAILFIMSNHSSGTEGYANREKANNTIRQYGGTNMGINFWFDDKSADYFDNLLPKIASTNTHIKIGVHHLVDAAAGYTVTPMDDDNFSVIKMCIEKAQALGIIVDMLIIYVEDKAWWKNPIEPTGYNVASFFANHKAAAMNVAALCNTYNIPIVGLINECDVLTNSDKVRYWADETRTIKTAYPNLKLTFASTTWNGETRKLLDYKKAGIDNICNYVDLLGMNLYPVLTTKPVAIVRNEDLINGWFGMDYTNASTSDCSMFQLVKNTYEAYKKPVLITEIGCVPKELGLADPLSINTDTKNSTDNKHVQYLYLKTVYDVLGECDFVAGIYIWDACDTWTPFYWLDNNELVPYITDYYKKVFNC